MAGLLCDEHIVSWKPEVKVEGEWSSNGLRFATEQEAKSYAMDLANRWTLVEAHRATPSVDDVSYTFNNGSLAPSTKPRGECDAG